MCSIDDSVKKRVTVNFNKNSFKIYNFLTKMLIKFGAILFLLQLSFGHDENHKWDLAVVISDHVELLLSNGSAVGLKMDQFSTLQALTFDNVRHQFIVSDRDNFNFNDTIFIIDLTKDTAIPIVQNIEDDVRGLAIDPISDTLFWTDGKNHKIKAISLSEPNLKMPKIIFESADQIPQDILIDVCGRRIYWTNSNILKASIESANLDGTDHKVLIDSDLQKPTGIAIDYKAQRLYWAEMRESIYYRIESSNLDGKERQMVYEGTHSKPFGMAVDEAFIYWTDLTNNALVRIAKGSNVVETLKKFEEQPWGLVVKNMQITTLPECNLLAETINQYNGSTAEIFDEVDEEEEQILDCLNNGKLTENGCSCLRGYSGRNCEISLCHNFCISGSCHLSPKGYPSCHCPNGYFGLRCQKDFCDNYCLNDGSCQLQKYTHRPSCNCPEGFFGKRCELDAEFERNCEIYCSTRKEDSIISQCRCGDEHSSKTNNTKPIYASESREEDFSLDVIFEHKLFSIQLGLIIFLIIVIIGMSFYMCTHKKNKRPRIKKRIIVNKNVTPLTYRPATEQCEITIENCCNMNVCETPCFEPLGLQKHEDKKTLLSNMENGEDLY